MVSLSSLDIKISIIITLKSDLSYDLRDFGTQPTISSQNHLSGVEQLLCEMLLITEGLCSQ